MHYHNTFDWYHVSVILSSSSNTQFRGICWHLLGENNESHTHYFTAIIPLDQICWHIGTFNVLSQLSSWSSTPIHTSTTFEPILKEHNCKYI